MAFANLEGHRKYSELIKTQVITCTWNEERENEWGGVTIGLGFTSDWIKKIGASF